MNWRLEILPDAVADIHTAAAWYEEPKPGLGTEFARTVAGAIAALRTDPLACRVRHRPSLVRWFLPPRFPFRIVYRVEGEVITIIGVFQATRHHRDWRQRL